MRTFLTIAAALAFGLGSTAQAAGLKDEAEIRDGLLVVGMAYEISEKCGSIDARKLRGITTLLNLKSRARELGYSSTEIDTYVDDKVEKKRLEGIARAQLVQLGVVPGEEASYCAVGRDQIAKGTGVGRLLR
ncbi:DUF5333 domain-containing protein [Loktanella sp. M215]|uniref:DUF5333 domain-containing protein n=1 Tax=Loktanella sp. M215 TaxID=2675431 RepID=UPI001F18F7F4|nr:DUF5333 domain-containing protein [Loktanella sp. M215]MBU2358878.1 DUF5333 domain-containing protein [Alphaproteobacteria bacterium]MCF7700388.1 hypothetical protein [Loktanella sp. M215]